MKSDFLDPFGNPSGDLVGEIVEASNTRFVAQCPPHRLHAPPAMGTFVRVVPVATPSSSPSATASPSLSVSTAPAPMPMAEEIDDPFADPEPVPATKVAGINVAGIDAADDTLYAIVAEAMTTSGELGRRASAYGLEEERLRAEQPQIYQLLATEFIGLPFGAVRRGKLRPGLPLIPPRLHAFVYHCSDAEVHALSATPDFVRHILRSVEEGSADDLLVSCLSQVYTVRNNDFRFLVSAGKQLAILLRDSPDRLASLLRKLEP